ncbi:hypothetical protein J3Q64DRAFT_1683858 [Phycomyces blakesleeanus]|uniref:Uncharacterized protein n=1 Tax=Phycomyces blakesleeanus TaxID=4837 RepID=A0ABR3AN72_PHYBL
MCVLTKGNDDMYDVSAAEFTNGSLAPRKFAKDHKKVLREAKVIFDSIMNLEYAIKRDTQRLLMP